jgi:hypothetical protein
MPLLFNPVNHERIAIEQAASCMKPAERLFTRGMPLRVEGLIRTVKLALHVVFSFIRN